MQKNVIKYIVIFSGMIYYVNIVDYATSFTRRFGETVDIKGRWALVTGASRGIGYLSAQFLAKQGCNLILHSRKKEHTQKIYDEVTASGVKAVTVEAELSDLDAVERMLEEIDEICLPLPAKDDCKRFWQNPEYHKRNLKARIKPLKCPYKT